MEIKGEHSLQVIPNDPGIRSNPNSKTIMKTRQQIRLSGFIRTSYHKVGNNACDCSTDRLYLSDLKVWLIEFTSLIFTYI